MYLDQRVQVPLAPIDAVTRIYIVARYGDRFSEYLSDLHRPFSGTYRTVQIETTHAEPDNQTLIELARLDLEAAATEVRLPAEPARPRHNELDFRFRRWAVSKAVVQASLAPALRERVILLMQDKRAGFTRLLKRFPVPAASDTRQAALSVETLVRVDALLPDKLIEMWKMLADLEQDIGQQIGQEYPPVVAKSEFQRYQQAVDALLSRPARWQRRRCAFQPPGGGRGGCA